MTTAKADQRGLPPEPGPVRRALEACGAPLVLGIEYVGAVVCLLLETFRWVWRSLVRKEVRFGRFALYAQIVRLGVRSIAVICLVSACIGLILALQMSPTLADYDQTDKVANVVAIAVFRELGPLITAVVLTGFAGASVAAEIGTMVVGEEIEALEAHALNPVRFLVMPRIMATVVSLSALCVLGDLVAVTAGWLVGVTVLDIPAHLYILNTIEQLNLSDFLTGVFKAAVFGALIAAIACYNGLSVTGGAAGVGKATTNTVVHSIVSIIFTDLIFTAIFYRVGWA